MTDVINDASVNEFATPPDTVFVQNSCNTPNRQRKTFDYNFPKPNYTCEWEKNGNLEERNSYFQARIEQMRELSVGADTILCDVKFKFATQEFF